MTRSNRILPALISAILLQTATWASKAAEPPEFEAQGMIEQIDSSRTTVVIGGRQYQLADELQVYGMHGGRFQLQSGERVSFLSHTSGNESKITEISVMEPLNK